MTTNRGRLAVILVVAGVIVTVGLLTGSSVLGFSSYKTAFVNKYSLTGTKLNSCDACHMPGDESAWNPYGQAVKDQIGLGIDAALAAVENLDSDGDGATNLAEINAHTWPGDAADVPATPTPSPTSAPTPTPTTAPTATPTTAPTVTTTPTTAPSGTPTTTPTTAPTPTPTPTTAPTASPTPAPTPTPTLAPTVTSVKVPQAPVIDGAVDALWSQATEVSIFVKNGVNMGSTNVMVRSVYTSDSVYFLLHYADPTESLRRQPWQKQANGTWKKLSTSTTHQENTYYEDKVSLMWDINIGGFASSGCATICHAGQEPANSGYGNMYTANTGELGDMWHWKSARTNPVGQVDDQYLNSDRYNAQTAAEAGRHSDPKTGGGYSDNQTADKTKPLYIAPHQPAPPYWILDSEKQPFADTYQPNDEIAGIIVAAFTGDRGDIQGKGVYSNGQWYLEMGRKLTTGSDKDIQFSDLTKPYHFGLAVFDNAAVEHAYQGGATTLVFAPAAPAALPRTGGQLPGQGPQTGWLAVAGVIAAFAILGGAGHAVGRRRRN